MVESPGCQDGHLSVPPGNTVLIRGVPIFKALTDALVENLASTSRLHRVLPRTVLFREGNEPEALHILLKGHVILSAQSTDGREAVTEIVQPVRHIALATVLARLPHVVSAETVARSDLLVIPTDALHDLMHSSSEFAGVLMRAHAMDYMAMVREVCDLKLRTATERLADYLLQFVQDNPTDAVQVQLPIGKQLLAARLGCRQENLSRAFSMLRNVGVETHGRRVILHNVQALRAYALSGNASEPKLP